MDETIVVTAPERLAAEDAYAFREALRRASDGRASVVIADLGRARYIASSGLGALVGASKLARRHGASLIVANVGEDVMEVFRLSELDKILDIRPAP